MFIGGLVSRQTEYMIMALVTVIGVAVLAFLAWDVIKRRRAAAGAGAAETERHHD
jgi:threonine/homoserine/homoserine lactone efflux protein